jgi:hypothetical protein
LYFLKNTLASDVTSGCILRGSTNKLCTKWGDGHAKEYTEVIHMNGQNYLTLVQIEKMKNLQDSFTGILKQHW